MAALIVVFTGELSASVISVSDKGDSGVRPVRLKALLIGKSKDPREKTFTSDAYATTLLLPLVALDLHTAL